MLSFFISDSVDKYWAAGCPEHPEGTRRRPSSLAAPHRLLTLVDFYMASVVLFLVRFGKTGLNGCFQIGIQELSLWSIGPSTYQPVCLVEIPPLTLEDRLYVDRPTQSPTIRLSSSQRPIGSWKQSMTFDHRM
ncbi:hypothetical protein AVEN_147210-1 [Araneus ventricosus]|uniref:Uncharacterized protein n=1 Tax=Araneus ventricosus TaxID=182803 RepID=A0A4Y2GVH6_ARAVE|nr:hypothetical protein AVEN_98346-1 [Araneus ventricosus]GBM56518.1 hypothetical protein AVEN_92745-1 [Araneus ventricosus]GBM56537.1 hypothetical protein AVEN_124297-1 [Araneus ventricosus]GBM56543.1 hypothetical protein AVEN_147210-1 [Araneus ventricosus]